MNFIGLWSLISKVIQTFIEGRYNHFAGFTLVFRIVQGSSENPNVVRTSKRVDFMGLLSLISKVIQTFIEGRYNHFGDLLRFLGLFRVFWKILKSLGLQDKISNLLVKISSISTLGGVLVTTD